MQTPQNTRVLPLTTQQSLFLEIEATPELSVDQLRYRTNSPKLREKSLIIGGGLKEREMRELSAEAALMIFKALAGEEGATPFQRRQAQEEILCKCLIGDMEGLLDAAGINIDAFTDQVRKAFPNEEPREALIKFAQLITMRANSISVEKDRERRRQHQKVYDDFDQLAELEEE